MSPTTGIATSQLKQLIYYHLDNDLLDTANFLAGRLHALEPRNPDAAHLLAITYYRLRRYKAAFDFAHKFGSTGRHLGCAYVFSQACLQLGRYSEGVTALEKSKTQWVGRNEWQKYSETSRRHTPDAAACSATPRPPSFAWVSRYEGNVERIRLLDADDIAQARPDLVARARAALLETVSGPRAVLR